MGMSLVAVFLMAGSMSTSQIVASQAQTWWFLPLAPAFVIYLISMVGEVNRLPFDLPEAEGELVAGHMTEYSSMKFGWFYLSEYVNMFNVSAVATTMFFGGWHAPWPLSHIEFLNGGWFGILWFFLKMWFFMLLMIWTRSTLLRFRYDQFMQLGWKRLIPISLAWLVMVAIIRAITQWVSLTLPQLIGGVAGIFVIALIVMWFADSRDARKETLAQAEKQERLANFDPMADGFPVPPLPGQQLPPSPRANRVVTAAALEETND